MAIPRKIHYCWFGDKKITGQLSKCIQTWKKIMPDYELKLWNENNFDINCIPFVQEAYQAKKWAFVSDYARLYALYNEGGLYFDTDVIVKRRFDDFLENEFFSAVEHHPNNENLYRYIYNDGTLKDECYNPGILGIGVLAAIMGSTIGHPFIKECLDYYKNNHFKLSNGEYNMKVNPAIYAEIAYKYGFRYKDVFQKLEGGMVFYPSSVLAGEVGEFTEGTYALHYCENSWKKIKDKITAKMILKAFIPYGILEFRKLLKDKYNKTPEIRIIDEILYKN
jgi:mannosyltransferase OCH1-like enzyme